MSSSGLRIARHVIWKEPKVPAPKRGNGEKLKLEIDNMTSVSHIPIHMWPMYDYSFGSN